MQTAKQIARELIDQLPESASWDDVMYALYVRQKLDRSQQEANEGKVPPTTTHGSEFSAMRIDWSDLALNDIDEIRHYIAKDSPFYAPPICRTRVRGRR